MKFPTFSQARYYYFNWHVLVWNGALGINYFRHDFLRDVPIHFVLRRGCCTKLYIASLIQRYIFHSTGASTICNCCIIPPSCVHVSFNSLSHGGGGWLEEGKELKKLSNFPEFSSGAIVFRKGVRRKTGAKRA